MSEGGYQQRRGREGSRWYNERPTADDLSRWFAGVRLHDGMEHEDYIAGIALIEQTEQHQEVVAYHGNGEADITLVNDLVYTPYPRAEARLSYFWRLMELRRWTGKISPAFPPSGAHELPEGFFKLLVTDAGGKPVPLVGRSMVVRITERGEDIHTYPSESKTVPMLRNGLVDPDAMAKASTGAISRALGVAGMLVLPGTGIATAEDMQSLSRGESGVPAPAPAAPAAPVPDFPALRTQFKGLEGTDQHEVFQDWWSQRGFTGMADLQPEDRTVVGMKLTELLAIAKPLG